MNQKVVPSEESSILSGSSSYVNPFTLEEGFKIHVVAWKDTGHCFNIKPPFWSTGSSNGDKGNWVLKKKIKSGVLDLR